MPARIAKPTSHESKETQKGHGQIGPPPEVGLGSPVKMSFLIQLSNIVRIYLAEVLRDDCQVPRKAGSWPFSLG